MQPNIEQLMTYQDILTMANNVALLVNELKEVKQELKEIKEATQPEAQQDILLYNLDDIAKFLKCSKKMAQRLKNMPNFPQSELGRCGKYKIGPWSSAKVLAHYNIHKNKV